MMSKTVKMTRTKKGDMLSKTASYVFEMKPQHKDKLLPREMRDDFNSKLTGKEDLKINNTLCINLLVYYFIYLSHLLHDKRYSG